MNLVWLSICSTHTLDEFQSDCSRCSTGNWIDEDDPETIADRLLWKQDSDAWRIKHQDDVVVLVNRDLKLVRTDDALD